MDAPYAIQGEAIEALTRSGTVKDLFLNNVALNESTLVAVLNHLCNGQLCERHVDMRSDIYIFKAIIPALQFLADAPAEKFAKTTMELTVSGMTRMNLAETQITLAQRQQLKLQTMKKLVEAIKNKHPDTLSYIRVTLRPFKVGNKNVKLIDEFHLLFNVKPKRMNQYLSLVGVDSDTSKASARGGVYDKKQTSSRFYEVY